MRINEDYMDINNINEYTNMPFINDEDDSFSYLDMIPDVKLKDLETNYDEIIDINRLCPLSLEMERTEGNIEPFSLIGSVYYSFSMDLSESLKNSINPVTVINQFKDKIELVARDSRIPDAVKGNHQNAEIQLKDYFMLNDFQIKLLKKSDGIVFINITIPDLTGNREIVSKAMGGFGYFLSKDKVLKKKSKNDVIWAKLIYEPNYQPYVTRRIRKLYPYLYHLAPAKYYKPIMKEGLIPHSNHSSFQYPARNFVLMCARKNERNDMMASKSADEMRLLSAGLNRNKADVDNSSETDNIWMTLRIDVSKLPKNVKLSYDQNCYPLGLFTYDTIPPSAIELYDLYKFIEPNEYDGEIVSLPKEDIENI